MLLGTVRDVVVVLNFKLPRTEFSIYEALICHSGRAVITRL